MEKVGQKIVNIISVVASLCTIFTCLSGMAISVTLKRPWYFILLSVTLILVMLCSVFIIRKIRYINFIEFLFCNKTHRFTLLPKFRIHIEKQHKKNKVHLNSMKIKYNITKSDDIAGNVGNLEIQYELQIKNKNLPRQYYLVFGNDYAQKKPDIIYSIGQGPEAPVFFNEEKHAPYERGLVNDATINLSPENLPKRKNISLKITYRYENSFNFDETPTDTLIFLPALYGRKIEHIEYTISLSGFDAYHELFCNANEISANHPFRGNYEIKTINDQYLVNKDLLKTIEINNVKDESAYYFSIGVSEDEMGI